MDIIESVNNQIKEEIGNAKLNKFELQMIQMKYGTLSVELTPSEKYLIKKEELRGI